MFFGSHIMSKQEFKEGLASYSQAVRNHFNTVRVGNYWFSYSSSSSCLSLSLSPSCLFLAIKKHKEHPLSA